MEVIMGSKLVENYRIIAKEIRNHLNSEEFRLQRPEMAFVQWYAKARFGDRFDVKVIDGCNDGGIDAIIEGDNKIFIIQSKYEIQPRVSTVSRDEISGFEKIAYRFLDSEIQGEFDKWLNTVRPELRPKYKAVRQKLLKDPQSATFLFITTKRLTYSEGKTVSIEDIQRMVSLWELYREGFTPPAESIELEMKNAWTYTSDDKQFVTYVGLADVLAFFRLMNIDKNERLFAQNVRTDLHSKINRTIRSTYEKEPEKFWLGNNGIYIICKRVVPRGNLFKLIYPSIINGSQTLHAIYDSEKRHSCRIMVRILEMDVNGDAKLLSAVIRRTNTQNPMKLINLSAHDSYQLNIGRYLNGYKVFYERREKEWKNEKKSILPGYCVVGIKEVAQWLSTQHVDIGFGRARSRVADLFEESNYKDIFEHFDQNFKSNEYRDLRTMIWAGFFVQNLIGYFPKKVRPQVKMSQLLLIKSLFDSINIFPELKQSIDHLVKQHHFGVKKIPRVILSQYRTIIKSFLNLQRKQQKKDVNIDYSNFFKRDEFCRNAYQAIFTQRKLKNISRLLNKNQDKIG